MSLDTCGPPDPSERARFAVAGVLSAPAVLLLSLALLGCQHPATFLSPRPG